MYVQLNITADPLNNFCKKSEPR